MATPEFRPFPSINRLARGCIITEKIDGSNALIHITESGAVFAGSRNRWITPGDDNFGFAAWVAEREEELRALGPGYHYGEWWGAGIQRRYGLVEKRFSLFNVGRWVKGDGAAVKPACCHTVPIIYEGPFNDTAVADALVKLRSEGSLAAPGFMNPEGVVVFHQASGHLYKVTLDGDGHKGAKRAA